MRLIFNIDGNVCNNFLSNIPCVADSENKDRLDFPICRIGLGCVGCQMTVPKSFAAKNFTGTSPPVIIPLMISFCDSKPIRTARASLFNKQGLGWGGALAYRGGSIIGLSGLGAWRHLARGLGVYAT